MDAASALADLTEVSTQVEAAVLLDDSGAVLAAAAADTARSERLARAAVDLLAAAHESKSSGRALTQLEATLRDGSVFVARDDGRSIVAVTGSEPTSGLVFYDLRRCLRTLAEAEKPRKKPRARRPKDEPNA
jgi:predicted regulator of Ras-like GTPase activity (Roadblock/LC7/MglB family)